MVNEISLTCMYINPEIFKYDTTEMATATNEGCIGWLLENCYLRETNETFDSERFKSIKGDFSDGGNE